MPKISRVLQKIFSLSGTNGQFGSAQAGTKLLTSDAAAIQALAAWAQGWGGATISGDKLPTLEEMNGVLLVLSQQIAYGFQEGIAEYDASTTYYANSIVKKPGSYQLYGSIGNDNTGNALTDTTKWVALADLASAAGAQSLTANGYKVFAGGLIMQWGSFTSNAPNVSVTFPITFPNAGLVVIPVSNDGGFSSSAEITQVAAGPSTTGFSAACYLNTSGAANGLNRYIAIGY